MLVAAEVLVGHTIRMTVAFLTANIRVVAESVLDTAITLGPRHKRWTHTGAINRITLAHMAPTSTTSWETIVTRAASRAVTTNDVRATLTLASKSTAREAEGTIHIALTIEGTVVVVCGEGKKPSTA